MFPDPCGRQLAEAVRNGADPKLVVPDDYVVVRGGLKPLAPPGDEFSASVGPTLEAAACAVPHGTVRVTTAGEIRGRGGTVEWFEEHTPHGTLNEQHVHVTEPGSTCFSELQRNPVPKKQRIDGGS